MIVVVGTFAILGTFVGLQVDALFVTAMLTVIGFSVHDTIVVYDRDSREPRSATPASRSTRSSTTACCRPSAGRSTPR